MFSYSIYLNLQMLIYFTKIRLNLEKIDFGQNQSQLYFVKERVVLNCLNTIIFYQIWDVHDIFWVITNHGIFIF
jgi:hypothetical protein